MILTVLSLLATLQQKTFFFPAATAQKLQLAGDYKGWDAPIDFKKKGDQWVLSLDLPTTARFEYKLIADNKWIADPNAKVIDNSIGGENSVYEGPDYKFSNTEEGEPKKPLLRLEFKVDGRTVILFAPARSAGLPILVYGDGQNYEKYGKIQNVVENLVEEGKIKPVVLALVPPVDRMNEYGLGWKSYADLIFNKVLPKVRSYTRASSKASDLYMGGSSMGGVISLRLAEEYPDKLAGGVHSQSGAFQYRPRNLKFDDIIEADSFKKLAPSTRLWLDYGTFEQTLTSANKRALKTLDSLQRPYGTLTTDEGHNWTAWRNRMVPGLIYLLKP